MELRARFAPLSRLRGESGKSEALLRPLERPELCEGLGRRAGAGGEGAFRVRHCIACADVSGCAPSGASLSLAAHKRK
ncbi:hypothetical protein PSEUDO8BK_30337 [Pseudomonas sp. 8BK]|nr:hypothetical protein PSEUDO8BK_30337 [Pseudomonas sp. 8BK]